MRHRSSVNGFVLLLAAAACGGDGGGPGPNTGATQMALQAGNNQVAEAGTDLAPLAVLVRDGANAPVPGVTVNWAVGTGGGAVSASTSVSDASGIASIVRTLGPNAGAQTTTATRSGLSGSPVTFTATATIQGATQIALSSGNNQTGLVSATLATPYAVLVRNHNNAPVQGVTVNWSTPGGCPSISPVSSQTNAAGIATADRTLCGTSGTQTAQATVAGLIGSPVTFTATAALTAASITVTNNNFGPGSETIRTGSVVTWTWNSSNVAHNVTFGATAGAPANIPNTNSGSVDRTFNSAGVFNYQCTLHAGMTGSITVVNVP